MIKVIGISFSDNDFANTFRGFLECIKINGIESYENLDKAKIVELFEKSKLGLYYLFQNHFRYKNDDDRTMEWLTISENDIYLNEEVDAYLKDDPGKLNGEFHVLDVRVYGDAYIYSA